MGLPPTGNIQHFSYSPPLPPKNLNTNYTGICKWYTLHNVVALLEVNSLSMLAVRSHQSLPTFTR